jgi:CRP/FNR family cyclic AMP-dependent transcriptional regulator
MKDVNFQSFPAGTIIFDEGEMAEFLYVLEKGEVELIFNGKVLETVYPGGIFGELGILDTMPRTGTAVAKTDCLAIPVNQEKFLGMVQKTPLFALHVMQAMSDRIRRSNKHKGE